VWLRYTNARKRKRNAARRNAVTIIAVMDMSAGIIRLTLHVATMGTGVGTVIN